MPAGALLVVNPFELYQVNCSENAEMIAMQIPENLLQLASWSRQNVCFCYASSQNEKQEYQTIRVLFATIFQDFFQNPEQNASFSHFRCAKKQYQARGDHAPHEAHHGSYSFQLE